MNILVIAAHPDDEVLGCGGTMARLADDGHDVHILILGEGITSRYEDPSKANSKEIEALHTQAKEVGASLGAKGVHLASLPDNRFDSIPLLNIIKIIEEHVQRIKPEVVYTQHGGDLNIDHVCTFRAVLTATRPMEGSPVKQVLAYRVASSTEWAFNQFEPTFTPTVFSDIAKTLNKKIAAMEMYEGEARTFPHPRSPEALRAEAEYFGSIAGLKAAEVFSVIYQKQ
ncbi:MAG: PIG-L family deacetylase [Candidatus Peribacteraceae bacterium]|jgi:LmbE family N-acetylglucosaminyl deacetylase|nr:PIG-L family deacetylase [Candidatus Peribacteraceae bacterium]|tara:strand:+ start:2582 stop:3262 length:681 start_codon:yes stop_codon:yes gene_type:complete